MLRLDSLIAMLSLVGASMAFVAPSTPLLARQRIQNKVASQPTSSSTARAMLFDPIETSNFLLSTIDSDIANVPVNEFAPIFRGGIMIMCSGVFGAIVVSFIVKNAGSAATLLAEAYVKDLEDKDLMEENLSPEWTALLDGNEEMWKELDEAYEKGEIDDSQLLQRVEERRNAIIEEFRAKREAGEAIASGAISAKDEEEEDDDLVAADSAKERDIFSDYEA